MGLRGRPPGVEKSPNSESEEADVSERNRGEANGTCPAVSADAASRDALRAAGTAAAECRSWCPPYAKEGDPASPTWKHFPTRK